MKHRIIYLLNALCILLTGCSALPVNTGDEIAYWTGEAPFNAAVIPAAPTCTDGVFYADGQALPTETFSGTLPEGQLTFLCLKALSLIHGHKRESNAKKKRVCLTWNADLSAPS